MVSLLVGTLASGCDLLTGPDGTHSLEYGVDVLEVFEVDHEWADHVIAYLRASLFAVNQTNDSVTVSMPSCVLPLEAVPGPDAGPTPATVWRSINRLGWPGSVPFGCFGGIEARLGPGDTLRTLTTEIPLAEILADSLSAGTYRFRARIQSEVMTGSSSRTEDPLVELGEVYLPESRYPLSLGVYPRDGFYYRVNVLSADAPGAGARAILEVTHTARFSGALTRDLSAECPVRLLAFRSADERETIPVPEPTWTWPDASSCDADALPVRLGPGEKWTFEADVPTHVIEAKGGRIEDFFLMAVIEVDGRPIRLAVDPCISGGSCASGPFVLRLP